MTKPNIILVSCDQMRMFDVGCYGNNRIRTPNIDKLAAQGVLFETAVTTTPVCTPARSCWLAGQHTRTCAGMLTNVYQNPPNPRRQRLLDATLPEILKANGYQTATIGKWHVDPQPQLVGFDRAVYPCAEHRYYGQTVFNERAEATVVDEFLEDFFAEHVEQYLRDAGDKPFFLNYCISPPHQPIGPGHLPEKYTQMYGPDDVVMRPNTAFEGRPPQDPDFWFRVYRTADYFLDWCAKRPVKPEDDSVPEGFGLQELTALYYGAITCVDDYIGRLMAAITNTGLADNSIVLFTSDHGDNLGSHGLYNKNSWIEESIRIPMIISGARGRPGNAHPQVITDTVASLADVAPTLLDRAGIDVPDHMQGRSLFRDPGSKPSDCAFIETGAGIIIRTLTHKYGLRFATSARTASQARPQFFDLSRDPYEMTNLADTGQQAELEAELRGRLIAWDKATPWSDCLP